MLKFGNKKDSDTILDFRFNTGDTGVVLVALMNLVMVVTLYFCSMFIDGQTLPIAWWWVMAFYILCWEVMFITAFFEYDIRADFTGILQLKFSSAFATIAVSLVGMCGGGVVIALIELIKHVVEVGKALMWPAIVIGIIVLFFGINYLVGKKLINRRK